MRPQEALGCGDTSEQRAAFDKTCDGLGLDVLRMMRQECRRVRDLAFVGRVASPLSPVQIPSGDAPQRNGIVGRMIVEFD